MSADRFPRAAILQERWWRCLAAGRGKLCAPEIVFSIASPGQVRYMVISDYLELSAGHGRAMWMGRGWREEGAAWNWDHKNRCCTRVQKYAIPPRGHLRKSRSLYVYTLSNIIILYSCYYFIGVHCTYVYIYIYI